MSAPSDVIIVGAGLAGLTAATQLQAHGRRVLLLDGADRVGGRIRTVTDPVTGRALADLGPTWVWPPYQPVVARWLETLRVPTFAQYDAGDGLLDGWGPDVQRWPLPGQDGMRRVAGGPGALIAALDARLAPGSLRLAAPVVSVHAVRDALVVTLASGEALQAAHVIVATPLRVAAARIAMPDLSEDVLAQLRTVPTWMGAQAKAVVLYDRPFWRDEGLSGRIASRAGPLAEVHDHTPVDASVGALFGFVQWSPAERRARADALPDAILAQLVRCLGPRAASPTAVHVEDWAMRPLVCGPQDDVGPWSHPAPAPATLRGAQLGGRLRFAVSETSDVSPGLIEGAFAAGERAAQAVLALRSVGA